MTKTLVFFLLTLKIASIYRKGLIILEYKKIYLSILKKLYFEGFIQSYLIISYPNKTKNKSVKVFLRFWNNFFLLKNLKIISKPSCVYYIKYKQLIYNIFDIKKTILFSTTRGLKTHYDCKQNKIGGKILFSC